MSQDSDPSSQDSAEKTSRRNVLVAIPAGAAGSVLSLVVTALLGRSGTQPAPAPAPAPADPRAAEDVLNRLKTVEDMVKELRTAFDQMRAAEHDRNMRDRILKDVEERFRVLEEAVQRSKPKR